MYPYVVGWGAFKFETGVESAVTLSYSLSATGHSWPLASGVTNLSIQDESRFCVGVVEPRELDGVPDNPYIYGAYMLNTILAKSTHLPNPQ